MTLIPTLTPTLNRDPTLTLDMDDSFEAISQGSIMQAAAAAEVGGY